MTTATPSNYGIVGTPTFLRTQKKLMRNDALADIMFKKNQTIGKFVNPTLENLKYEITEDGTKLPNAIAWESAIKSGKLNRRICFDKQN